MSELIIKLTGEITDTNFDEWKNELLARLKNVNTELSSCLLYTSPSPRDRG